MKPALLFGGNVTSYVAWAVTKESASENLGELFVMVLFDPCTRRNCKHGARRTRSHCRESRWPLRRQ